MTTDTVTYVTPVGEPFPADAVAVIDKYRDDLMSGRALALAAMSHRTNAFGGNRYRPPIRHDGWATCMERIARMARQSDRMAVVARGILGRVNLYGTDDQAMAAVYESAFNAMKEPYVDYVGLAGPEPGRRSDRTHDWTIHDRVAVAYWLEYAYRPFAGTAPGVGWCLAAIARAIRFRVPAEMEVTR